ncbi:restriction endonuclease subunit S [Phocaeicola coprocola DSM 17136]|jgi:type I restriction enzyme S subunit|uniref:restriction endonuclease subunit S n=1 Tax=Bacteroidaceae TaxID=815 RepID=UPI001D15ACF8|nr:restriction endonuclease subunit S [Bacteroides ovatus]MCC3349173.1 restriction endonuclease subunit S [Phocaeicola coprocola DSM 17136]MDC2799101.1 restriction endonuclease subunit S [Bacteroides ovatus]
MDTKKLRQKILDLAIHGKLVPQDPNDEPASVLLERIKAEKERLIKEGKIKKSKKSTKASDTPHYENVPFEVPESWVWCKFQDCMDVRDGTHDSPKYTQEGYPLITSKDFKNGQFDFSKTRYISEVDYKNIIKRSKVDIGDILYSMIGGNIGSMIYIQHDNYFDMAIKNVALFKPYQNSDISTKYIAYFLESKIKEYQAIAIGGAQPFVGLDIFRNTLVPLPPLAEQHRIITEIEKWLALIDQIEQGKVDLQTIIKQTKSKILDLAIHGKLVPQDPNDEPAIKLLKRINPDFTPCDNGHYTQLPDGWQIASMQTLCNLTDGEKQSGIKRINLDVKFLRGEREAKSLLSGKFVTANTLLILVDGENSGEVFRSSIDGYQGSTFKQLRINENMNEEYVLQVINLHRKILRESKVGSAIPHLNKKIFKAIEVPIPPYKEQQKIIKAITKAFMSLDLIMESL